MTDDRLTDEMRAEGLRQIRAWLARVKPSLRLSEYDSYAMQHFIDTGHVFRRGCCKEAAERDQSDGGAAGKSPA